MVVRVGGGFSDICREGDTEQATNEILAGWIQNRSTNVVVVELKLGLIY